jgi:hypothetical protein
MHQGTLFDSFGSLAAGLMPGIKASMRASIEESGLSRAQILDKMNTLALAAGVKLTSGNSKDLKMATFEKWLNPADRDHIPGILALNVFCRAVGSVAPIAAQIRLHGFDVMGSEDLLHRDYGRACLAEREARKKKRQLEATI